MATVGEARLIILGEDRTSAAFAAAQENVRKLDKAVGAVVKSTEVVDKIAKSVAPMSARLGAIAQQVERVTEATRGLSAEQSRLQLANERLGGFQAMTGALEKADAALIRAKTNLRNLWQEIAASAAPTKALQNEYTRAEAAVARATQAFEAQKTGVAEARAGFEEIAGPLDTVASAQARLAGEIERVNGLMAAQGRAAAELSEKLAAAVRQEEESQKRRGVLVKQMNDMLPLAGPIVLGALGKALGAGATVEERIAQLQTSGAKPGEIDQARGDYREFSKTHAGMLEADYLAAYKDARVIAPDEPYDMARLGSRYVAAARNSGLSTTENDVGNVMRIMDELGLKDMGQREELLNSILKSQQAFGSQISTETMLAAYRNAKQSIYDWSPEFREKIFPTLLQSSGQQGGTEMMTALNNYIGQHMQLSELKALINAGFVNNSDLTFDHNHPVLKPGAHLFEADTFKSNIAQWAWDFHDHFMQRKGATEGQFDELIAKMPRNMAALIAFLVHNDPRIHRDMQTLDKPVGLAAEGNASLANNPVAGMTALKDAIEQLGAAATSPVMKPAADALSALANDISNFSAAVGEFSKAHPDIAKVMSGAALGGAGAFGLYQSVKLLSGFGSLLTGGGDAKLTGSAAALTGSATALDTAAAELSAAAVKMGGRAVPSPGRPPSDTPGGGKRPPGNGLGWAPWLFGLGTAVTAAEVASAPKVGSKEWAANVNATNSYWDKLMASWLPAGWVTPAAPQTPIDAVKADKAREIARKIDLNPLGLDRYEMDAMRSGDDREAMRGRALSDLKPSGDLKVSLDPASKADISVRVTVEPSGDLIRAAAAAQANASGNLRANVGVSTAGVAPNGQGGIGSR